VVLVDADGVEAELGRELVEELVVERVAAAQVSKSVESTSTQTDG
jgi:hypothetical protein